MERDESNESVRLVIISDTHNFHQQVALPEGDILIHAGDITSRGKPHKMEEFCAWLYEQPFEHKVVIAGNHDFCMDRDRKFGDEVMAGCDYLLDSSVECMGLKIYGSPYQPWFHDWAFNLLGEETLREKWSHIPEGLDILITHGPPFGVLDKTLRGERVGCHELRKALSCARPRMHVFGHIHEDYGWAEDEHTLYVNGSTCTLQYQPTNAPIVVDIPVGEGRPRVISAA